MRLYFDFGNTRIKWAADNDNADIDYDCLNIQHASHQDINSIFHFIENNPISKVSIASPRDMPSLIQLTDYLKSKAIDLHRLQVNQDLFKINYKNTTQFGIDRYLNLIAGNAICNTPFCVISAGTATTVDFYDGQTHCGGAIFLGLHSQIEKMAASTGLELQINTDTNLLLGTNTNECLTVGLLVGYKLMLENYLSTVNKRLETFFNPLYTGGNAKLISENKREIDYNLNFLGIKIYNKKMGI